MHAGGPQNIDERESMAQVCAVQLNLQMPMLLDDMSNSVDTLYAALPERLSVLDATGIVQFRTVVGSPGFDVDAFARAVESQAVSSGAVVQ